MFTHVVIDIEENVIAWAKSEEEARAKASELSGKDEWEDVAETHGVVDLEHFNDREIEEDHDVVLDDCCDEIKIGNLTYSPSSVLKAVDPIAYRCSIADHISYLIEMNTFLEGPDGEFYRLA